MSANTKAHPPTREMSDGDRLMRIAVERYRRTSPDHKKQLESAERQEEHLRKYWMEIFVCGYDLEFVKTLNFDGYSSTDIREEITIREEVGETIYWLSQKYCAELCERWCCKSLLS